MDFPIADQEHKLAERLRSGDSAAMQDFYAQYGGRLAATCTRYVGNKEDVKDVLQDTMIKLLTNISNFEYRGKGSLQAWATRLVINQSISFLREKKRQEWTELTWDLPDIPEKEDPSVDDLPPEVIQQFICQLPTGYRTVFNLYVLEEKSHQEIARLLGIKQASSASQLHRAKALLAKMITEYRTHKQEER